MRRFAWRTMLLFLLFSVPLFAQDTISTWPDIPASTLLENGQLIVQKSHEISAEDLAQRLLNAPDSLYLVDLRTPDEREIGTIPGNHSIGMDSVFTNAALRSLPRNRTIVLYCSRGTRSTLAWFALRNLGLDVWSLEGGFGGWKQYVLAEPEMEKELVQRFGP